MLPDFSRFDRNLRIATAVALLVGILVPLGAWQYLQFWLVRPLQLDEVLVLELPSGGNLTSFLAELQRRGAIDHPLWLRYYARVNGVADRVKAGEYRLEPGISPRGVLDKLVSGDVVRYPFTIIEGTSVEQLLQLLQQSPRLHTTLDSLEARQLLQLIDAHSAYATAEGLLFPDTYHYHLGMSDLDLLRMAYERMQQILEEEWQGRQAGLPYRNAYDALIMASLIEKETGASHERAQIAGAFVRRLQRGMLLQTDPSVIYGMGKTFNGNLRRSDLQQPGPYNTYVNGGLPPTPIAFPGRSAIAAALHPASGDALYFVARGDGTHEFSATLEQHNRAVRRLQVNQRARNYRSRPSSETQ